MSAPADAVRSRGSGLASAYGILTGLMLSAALGWPYVAAYAITVGPGLGWKIARRTA